MKFKTIIYSLCIATFMFACEANDIDVVEAPANLSKTTSFDLKNNKNANSQSGAYIMRFDNDEFAVVLVDGERGITGTYGADNVAFCNGDPDPFGTASNQIINLPIDEARAIFLQKGEVYTEIFDGTPTGDFCDFLLNTPILAKGMSKFVATDNDLNVSGNNNTNTFGARGHGRLMNQDNETVNYNGQYHIVDDKNGNVKFNIAIRLQRN